MHCITNTYIERVRTYCLTCVCLNYRLYCMLVDVHTIHVYMYITTILVTVSILSTEPSDMSSMCSTTLASVWYSWLHSMVQCLTQQTRRDCLSAILSSTSSPSSQHCEYTVPIFLCFKALMCWCFIAAGPDYTHWVYYCTHMPCK